MAANISLKSLIVRAYGIRDYQLEGPAWLDSEAFDVSATFPKALPQDHDIALRNMMQKMLADRFKLVIHHEQKIRPVYGLVVGKSGIKFKEAPGSECSSHGRNINGAHFIGTCVSMDAFTEFLTRPAERRDLPEDLPVLDMTGLTGWYNLTLGWVPAASARTRTTAQPLNPSDDPSGITLAEALEEQLGLKLEAHKAPIDTIVVDDIQKAPTSN
jgi:uncharacterized protein (TIGR03435 family)